ncbi:MAG: hypothetical protein MZV65_18670 [Chromatiales bacterium]|nr:hypothetical protein [Chromatiales bacterium]
MTSTTPSPSRPPTGRSRRCGTIEKAIELNDNRAVYRSRAAARLRPSPPAARASPGSTPTSASSSSALVEGWKSVNTDPTNFSAHRFLADSYAVLPRHEIARVSELFAVAAAAAAQHRPRSQPRLGREQPVPDQLAGSWERASFNEFNPLFNARPGFNGAGRLRWSASTTPWPATAILAGIVQARARSASATAASRPTASASNNDQDDQMVERLRPVRASARSTSVQAEYRYRKTRDRRPAAEAPARRRSGRPAQHTGSSIPSASAAGTALALLDRHRVGPVPGREVHHGVRRARNLQRARHSAGCARPRGAVPVPAPSASTSAAASVTSTSAARSTPRTATRLAHRLPTVLGTIEQQSTTSTDIRHVNVYG